MLDSALSGRPVIVGAGLAGLACALALRPLPVVVLSRAPLGQGCASAWAQGGIAAALGAGDTAALHLEDTLRAGAGLCDADAARHLLEAAPAAIRRLEEWGVRFDRTEREYALSLEAAHSRPRVLHAGGGDSAGRRIMESLIAEVRASPSITVLEDAEVWRLATNDYGVAGVGGVWQGRSFLLPTSRVILATGGIGGLWRDTTNPSGALGLGIALAARAGAELVDLEFVQFHPTAIASGRDPLPLASEALRGDGARLIDDLSEFVTDSSQGGDLGPRDIVTRAVARHLRKGRKVFLDAREAIGTRFPARFPTVYAICREAGIDPVTMPIPVVPAAHYHMGGVAVDARCRTSLAGLWACGEVAATGLHGANRLASNSLLEAVLTGVAAAEDLRGTSSGRHRPPLIGTSPVPAERLDGLRLDRLRSIMTDNVGVERDRAGLEAALGILGPASRAEGLNGTAATTALLVAAAALRRQESRGGHYRSDFPDQLADSQRETITLEQAASLAEKYAKTPKYRARVAV